MSNERPLGGAGSIFLIDANNFLFRAFHGLPMLTAPDGTPVNAIHGYVRMIQSIRREFAPQYLLAVFDAKGTSFRNDFYPEYKANRPPAPEDLIPQIPLVRSATEAMSIAWTELIGYEADDLIAAYTAAARSRGLRACVISGDKDLMQLVCEEDEAGPAVRMWDSMKNRLIGSEQVNEKWGVGPKLLGDLLALTGDSVDNIPGVPGIGPKTAAALLTEYGSLEGVLAAASSIKQNKRRENLIEFTEQARLSRRLVELCDAAPMPVAIEDAEDHGVDNDKLEAFFAPLGFRSTLAGLQGAASTRGRRSASASTDSTVIWTKLADAKPFDADVEVVALEQNERLAELAAELGATGAVSGYVVRDDPDAMLAKILAVALVWGENPVRRVVIDAGANSQALADWIGLWADRDNLVWYAHESKLTGLVLEHHGHPLRCGWDDPELISYTIDPARTSHTVADLVEELLGFVLKAESKKAGKERKAVSLPMQADWSIAVQSADAIWQLTPHLLALLEQNGADCQRLYLDVERPLSRVLQEIQFRGILIDAEILGKQGEAVGEQVATLRAAIEADAGYSINPDSPLQLQKYLFEEKQLPATKKTKTGYSTDAEVLEELSLLDPIVKDILEYRQLTKLKGTYIDALPRLMHPITKRLHSHFRQTVAQTGRLSSVDPNLQNIPIRTEEGRRIRAAFVAKSGYELVTLDYSQIELRILAHLSSDASLVKAFVEGADVHRRTAAEIFEIEEEEVSSEQRRVAKAVNFGVIYGQSAFGLARQLGIRQGKAAQYIKSYFEKIPGVDRYMTELVEKARRQGYAETILGRKRRIPELSRGGAARAHGERIARNTPIQGSAADILKVAMVAVEDAVGPLSWAQMLLTVHDELIFECESGRSQELVEIVAPLMETSVKLSVPLVVESGHGPNWAEAKA